MVSYMRMPSQITVCVCERACEVAVEFETSVVR